MPQFIKKKIDYIHKNPVEVAKVFDLPEDKYRSKIAHTVDIGLPDDIRVLEYFEV